MTDLICDVINNCEGASMWKKLYDQIVIKNLKRSRDGHQTNFYVNFHYINYIAWTRLTNN